MIIREKMERQLGDAEGAAGVIREILLNESSIDQEKEHFWTIGVDAQNKPKFIDLVALGGLYSAVVFGREAFRLAVARGCRGVIFVHNHPSGSLKPSPMDLKITRTFSEAGRVLDIEVLDHIILGKGHCSILGWGEPDKPKEENIRDILQLLQNNLSQLEVKVKRLSRIKKEKTKATEGGKA